MPTRLRIAIDCAPTVCRAGRPDAAAASEPDGRGREVCVCYFVEILKQSQPKISQHLAYLRKAGMVSARREGK